MVHVNNAAILRRTLMTKVAGLLFKGELVEKIDRIPVAMFPRSTNPFRCCTYKDRAVIKYRLMALLGFSIENEEDELTPLSEYARAAMERKTPEGPLLTVVDEACTSCLQSRYHITNACRGCVARPCVLNCPKKAISVVKGQAIIDTDLCVACGLCVKACPYHAIIHIPIPCEEACPVGAISKGENGKEILHSEACIHCGKCLRECPFGAVMEKSQLVGAIEAMRSDAGAVALVAPAVMGQFRAKAEQIETALHAIGFKKVFHVAAGADKTVEMETAEFQHRLSEGAPLMATSCCPAWTSAVRLHHEEMAPYISDTPSPMHYSALQAKALMPEAARVFIGPCIAKKHEAARNPDVDFVLTVEELGAMFIAQELDVSACEERRLEYGGSAAGYGFALSGGVSAAIQAAVPEGTDFRPAQIDGIDRKALKCLKAWADGKMPGNFLEVMACEGGCVNGPAVVSTPKVAAAELVKLQEQMRG
jgi:[FeFe] hydrogenase (group B1/B3)